MLILFKTVESEFLVGISFILFGAVAVLSSLWHAKYNHKNREPYTVLFVWVLYVAAAIPMILFMNVWTVMIFLIVNEISKALLGVSYFSFMFRAISNLPKSGLRTESMVLREVMLNGGRILSVLTFIILHHLTPDKALYYLLFVIAIQGFLYKIITIEKTHFKTAKIKHAE